VKFIVAITEETLYEVSVEADTAAEAEELAEAEFLNSPDTNNYFSSVAERVVAAGDPVE